MRRAFLMGMMMGLVLVVGWGQTSPFKNLANPEPTVVAPGDWVLAQRIELTMDPASGYAGAAAAPLTAPTWSDPGKASFAPDSDCASTTAANAVLTLTAFNLNVPLDATILGIQVEIKAAREGTGTFDVRLIKGGNAAGSTVSYAPVIGANCGATQWSSLGGSSSLWGTTWTAADVKAANFGVQITAKGTFTAMRVDSVKVTVHYRRTITSVVMKNTVASSALEGAHLERIEVRRDSDSGPTLGTQTTAGELAKFTTTGVLISTASNNTFATGTHTLYIRIRLKATTTFHARGKFELGDTRITLGGILYTVEYPTTTPATTFEEADPAVNFEPADDVNVYKGQRFLAARIDVDATSVPVDLTINRLILKNVAPTTTGTKLTGAYIARIEVRRASNDLLLADVTSTTELAKLTTTGTVITTSQNNTVLAYSREQLEVWVTLTDQAPEGQVLQLGATLSCNFVDIEVDEEAPVATIGQVTGFDDFGDDSPQGGRVFSGQRFLAQRIAVADDDLDPYDVTVTSIVVQNVADASSRLAETHVARIEVVRGRDGAIMGATTNVAGLNSGGVRITTGTNNIVRDDTSEFIELWVTLGPNAPQDRGIQLQAVVWHSEDGKTFRVPPVGEDPLRANTFTTGQATAAGFESASIVSQPNRTVFQGARFVAQHLDLKDNDADPYDVIVTSLMIRNVLNEPADNPLADQHVARVEVRRKSDGALLGEVTNPVGLSLTGVRVATDANNVVPDDTGVELEIWITLQETTPAGRKLKLECTVWHTEGAATFQKVPTGTAATFTTAIGSPPTGVDFSWTPEAPNAGQEVTFTPAAGITDPHGSIANATFSWNFGDGATVQTKGLTAVKHTYTRGGTFSVTLTVTSEGGLSASKTRQITVKGQEPTVDFTYTPASPMVGQEVAFTSIVTDPVTPPLTPYTYAWDFGDGNTASVANPSHTYTAAGTYTVVLEVTNSRGETGRAQKSITVAAAVDVPPTVTARTASPANPEVGVEVTFTATATAPAGDPVTEWEWDFGDGSAKQTTTTGTVKHTYTASSVFTVTVRARNARGGWSGPRTLSLYVRPKGGALIGTKLLDNPARTQARIQVFLPQGATGVKIQIFDMLGRPVLAADVVGTFYTWNLTDQAGRRVADGLYVYLVTATVAGKTERSEVGRILVVR